MSSRAAASRVLVLATIVAAHAAALLVLLAHTRTRPLRGKPEASPLFVMLLEPRVQAALAVPTVARAGPRHLRRGPLPATPAEAAAPAIPAVPATTIDWAAEATASATRHIEAGEQRARQARALAPKQSPMFASQPKRPQFQWNYASTHRVEPLAGLGTVIHLNDQCAIFLFVILPFAGCALEKPPVRGDLFEHMHDPDPAPEP